MMISVVYISHVRFVVGLLIDVTALVDILQPVVPSVWFVRIVAELTVLSHKRRDTRDDVLGSTVAHALMVAFLSICLYTSFYHWIGSLTMQVLCLYAMPGRANSVCLLL